jgi:2-dehydro-3-deoxygalactonokinase
MDDEHMIGLDWGTSSLRAWRFGSDGAVLDGREAPRGIMTVAPGGFADVLRETIDDWIAAGERRVLLCGMVGSRQGWQEAPYLPCPAGAAEIARATVRCPSKAPRSAGAGPVLPRRGGVPEVMRGEETQDDRPAAELGDGEATVCLPGSHSEMGASPAGASRASPRT